MFSSLLTLLSLSAALVEITMGGGRRDLLSSKRSSRDDITFHCNGQGGPASSNTQSACIFFFLFFFNQASQQANTRRAKKKKFEMASKWLSSLCVVVVSFKPIWHREASWGIVKQFKQDNFAFAAVQLNRKARNSKSYEYNFLGWIVCWRRHYYTVDVTPCPISSQRVWHVYRSTHQAPPKKKKKSWTMQLRAFPCNGDCNSHQLLLVCVYEICQFSSFPPWHTLTSWIELCWISTIYFMMVDRAKGPG